MTFEELLDQYEPRIAAAFRECIEAIKSGIVLKTVVERLERGDIEGAIRAFQIEPEAYAALEIALAEAFNAGGVNAVGELPKLFDPLGNRVIWRFGVRDPATEEWLRTRSAMLVTGVVENQIEAIREALVGGLSSGQNPKKTAEQIAGRFNRVTRTRVGGIIGLTAEQARTVQRVRENLASGDASRMRDYLGLNLRDRLYDRTVAKAIREGRPVDREMLDKIAMRYADRALAYRGKVIALNETMEALSNSRDLAMKQQIIAGRVNAEFVEKTWNDSRDGRVRPSHKHGSLGGQKVPFDESFVTSSGVSIRFPHDPKAPTSETLGCRCWVNYRIRHIDQLAAKKGGV